MSSIGFSETDARSIVYGIIEEVMAMKEIEPPEVRASSVEMNCLHADGASHSSALSSLQTKSYKVVYEREYSEEESPVSLPESARPPSQPSLSSVSSIPQLLKESESSSSQSQRSTNSRQLSSGIMSVGQAATSVLAPVSPTASSQPSLPERVSHQRQDSITSFGSQDKLLDSGVVFQPDIIGRYSPVPSQYDALEAGNAEDSFGRLEVVHEEHPHHGHPVLAIGPSNGRFYANAAVVALGITAGALVNNLVLDYHELVSKIKNEKEGMFNLLLYNLLLKLFKGNYKHVNTYMQQLGTLGAFAAWGFLSELMTKGEAFGPTALVTSIISISLLLKGPLYAISGRRTYSGPLVEHHYHPPAHPKYCKNALKLMAVALPTFHAASTQFFDQKSLIGLATLLAIDGAELRTLKSLLKQKLGNHAQRLAILCALSAISTLIEGAIFGDIPEAMAWPMLYFGSNSIYTYFRTEGKSFAEHPHVEVLERDVWHSMGFGALNSLVFSALFKMNDALIDSSLLKTAFVAKQLHIGYEIQSKASKHESTLGRIAGIATSIGVAAISDTVINAIWENKESEWVPYLATCVATCVGAAYLGKKLRNWIFGK